MRITVKSLLTLKEISDAEEQMDLPTGITVQELLSILAKKHGRPFTAYAYDEGRRVQKYLQFLINGRNITVLQGLETELKQGDKVAIFYLAGGG
jgi:MoaD family protein